MPKTDTSLYEVECKEFIGAEWREVLGRCVERGIIWSGVVESGKSIMVMDEHDLIVLPKAHAMRAFREYIVKYGYDQPNDEDIWSSDPDKKGQAE